MERLSQAARAPLEPPGGSRTGPTAPPERWSRGGRRATQATRLSLEALLASLLTLLFAAWVLQLWRADLTLPLRYAPVDDTKFYLMLVKGIAEHGWYLSNPHLGAPFGQQLSDYPQGADNLNLVIIRFLALFSSNAALIVNLFFLLTFALVSFVAHLVLRSLGLSAIAATVASVLYALLAYHFFRGESHLLLSAYYAVPLAAYLFLGLLGDKRLFARRGGGHPRWLAWVSKRSLVTIAICVLIGSENLYYATFAAVMIVLATAVTLVLRRWRTALAGIAIVLLIAAGVAANLAPSLIYRAEHGTNTALERSAAFTEQSDEAFSLRLANLVLPAPDSRIAPLRHLAEKYDRAIAPGYCESCYASLGTVGTIGLLWLVLAALAALAGAGAVWFGARRLVRHASLGVILAVAVSTVGGLASLIEVFVTPDIRAWNRISVFIAFLSLLAVGLLLDMLRGALSRRRRGALLGGIASAAVLLFGVYDQTSASFIPSYAATAREWNSDARFVQGIEATLPRGASLFQLPYVPFPEGYPQTPLGDQIATYSTKYESLRGYLHSSTLRWSYGATKGRVGDWSAQLAGQPLSYVVAAAGAAGFDGVWVDPAGFEPGKAAQLRSALQALLGQTPLVSPRGDLWFFDLRPYLQRLRHSRLSPLLGVLRELTLHPLSTACHTGGLELFNPARSPRSATLSVHASRSDRRYDATHAETPAGQAEDYPASASVTVTRRLNVPAGRSFVRLDAPTGIGSGQVLYATLTDDALIGFAHSGGAAANALTPGLAGPPCTGAPRMRR